MVKYSDAEKQRLLKFLIESRYGSDNEKHYFRHELLAFESARSVRILSGRTAESMQSFFKGNWEGISPVDMSIEEAMTMARDSKVILSDACLRCFEIYYNLEYPRTIVSFERKTDPEFTPEEIQGLLKFLIESRFGAEDKQNDFANDEDVFNKAINTVYSLSAREAADIKSFYNKRWKGISPVDMSIEQAITLARKYKVILSDSCLDKFKHHYKLKYHRIIKNFEKKDDNDNGLGDVTQGVSSMKVQK